MKNSPRTTTIAVSLFLMFTTSAKSQDGYLDLLYGTPEDATKYSNSYFAPIFKGFGYGFNPDLSLEFCDEGLKYKKISYLGEEL